MKLNTTSQYAIKIMSYMASDDGIDFYHAKEISDNLEIPYKYLTRVMTMLVNADLIISLRGRVGGYRLSKDPSKIRLVDILDAVDESFDMNSCILNHRKCNEKKKCALHDKWKEPKRMIKDMFTNTTLNELV